MTAHTTQDGLLKNRIYDATDLSVDEQSSMSSMLDAAGELSDADGNIGRCLGLMIRTTIIGRLSETERINRIVDRHAATCPVRNQVRPLLGELSTKWGTLDGAALVLFLLLAAAVAVDVLPQWLARH
jgi:hypothetical protein